MRIIVRSREVSLWLPVPLSFASAAVNLLPQSAIADLKRSVPAPYNEIVTKDNLRVIIRECRLMLKEYKGLELVHVEARDGTFVSIRL